MSVHARFVIDSFNDKWVVRAWKICENFHLNAWRKIEGEWNLQRFPKETTVETLYSWPAPTFHSEWNLRLKKMNRICLFVFYSAL